MYSAKFSHYLKHKLPQATIREFYSDLCFPGKSNQKFYRKTVEKGVEFSLYEDINVENKNGTLLVHSSNGQEQNDTFKADMVILSPAMIPGQSTEKLGKILGLTQDKKGFFSTQTENLSPVTTEKEGIYIAGCAEGPKDIADSIAEAEAAAGKILAFLS